MILFVWRRAWRDRGLILSWTALVALACLLAVVTPQLVATTIDRGAQRAVADAGPQADVVVSAAVDLPESAVPTITSNDMVSIADKLPGKLPPALASVVQSQTLTVVSPRSGVSKVDGVTPDISLTLRLGLLGPDQAPDVRVVQGALPDDVVLAKDEPAGAVISEAAAREAGLTVGSVITLPPSFVREESGIDAQGLLKVVAIVDRVDAEASADAAPWLDMPRMWDPRVIPPKGGSGLTSVEILVLSTPHGVDRAVGMFISPYQGIIHLALSPQSFTGSLLAEVSAEGVALMANSSSLADAHGAELGTQTDLPIVLRGFQPLARAAIAQMSLMIAGVLGVAAIAVLLLSTIVARRRSTEFALERARGSSLGGIGVRAGTESLIASIVAGAIALGLASLILPGGTRDLVPAGVVLLIAVLAPVALAMLSARASWRAKREPANRPEKLELKRRARTQRLVVEGTILLVTIAALYAVHTRGLLQTRTDGVDPLLSITPLLLAASVTVIILRLYPMIVRLFAAAGRRSRGAIGLIGAMQVQRSLAILPLLALTLGVALTLTAALMYDTVRVGQYDASWQRVGAEARVEGAVTDAQRAQVAAAPGVSAASRLTVRNGVVVSGTQYLPSMTVIAVDQHYRDVITKLPHDAGGSSAAAAADFGLLPATVGADDPLPILLDKESFDAVGTGTFILRYDVAEVPVHAVGVYDTGPVGYHIGPFLYIDSAALAAQLPDPLPTFTLLAMGQGAEAAVASLTLTPDDEVTTRTGWLTERQQQPLNAGTTGVMVLASVAIALLATLALVATVLASARLRRRSLALLRTLGMRAGLGWWLAAAELAPIVIASVIGGVLSALAIMVVLAPALGFGLLAGGLGEPPPSLATGAIVWVIVGAVAMLGIAILVEVVAHRRDRLNEVLRVGDS